jgi:hypothetical protein
MVDSDVPVWSLLEAASGDDDDSDGLILIQTALWLNARRSLAQQPLPSPSFMQLQVLPKLLRRFLRGCVAATAHGLATAPFSERVDLETMSLWKTCMFMRVMNGLLRRIKVSATARNEFNAF